MVLLSGETQKFRLYLFCFTILYVQGFPDIILLPDGTESMGDPIFNTLSSQPKGDTHPYHLHLMGENKSCAMRAGKIQLLAEQLVPSNKQLYTINPW